MCITVHEATGNRCVKVNIPDEEPLSGGRSHKHQQQPETSHPAQSPTCSEPQLRPVTFSSVCRRQVGCSLTAALSVLIHGKNVIFGVKFAEGVLFYLPRAQLQAALVSHALS